VSTTFLTLLGAALGCAFFAIAAGRNLNRALVASMAFVALLGAALWQAGVGFVAFATTILVATAILTVQLFGWMLVDVDRDHVPVTDRGTALARGLAFALVALVLGLLASALVEDGALSGAGARTTLGASDSSGSPAVEALGVLLFGEWSERTALLGFAMAAGLLSALLLLRDDGRA